MSRRRGRRLILATLLLASSVLPASGSETQEPVRLALRPIARLSSDGTKALAEGEELHAGETLILAIDWPSELHPNAPRLLLSDEAATAGTPRALRLLRHDRRADGQDTIEVLLTALGETELPELAIGDGNGKLIARTLPCPLNITARESGESAPAQERPPVEIPLEWLSLALIAGGFVALAGLAAWGISRLPRRKRSNAPAPVAERVPAGVRALDALEALLADGLLERRLFKAFSVRLAEIGKGFLGEIAGVPLLELTSEECVHALDQVGFGAQRVAWLESWLRRLDLVKFAEDRPAVVALRESATELRRLIVACESEEEARESLAAVGETPAEEPRS